MTQPLKIVSYADQLEAARRTAQRAIRAPKEVTTAQETTTQRPVPAHVLQNRIEAEYTNSSLTMKNREKWVQAVGVVVTMVSSWVIGYSLYAHF